MANLSKVNIRPGVSILSVLPHLNYKPWFALAEFVDNAVQSFLTNRAVLEAEEGKGFILQVDINLDPNRQAITIRDNAAGIGVDAFPRAFRPAEIPPDAKGLSEFGMGMKSAACWFAPKWAVRTKALDERDERTVQFDIARIVKDSIEELDVAKRAVPRVQHYTEITLREVRAFPQKRTVGKIKDHLASIYRCFTREGTLRLHFDGEPLLYETPNILKASYYKNPKKTAVIWKKRVSLKLSDKRSVEGFVAIREKGSTARAGLALFRRKRLILGSADETYRPPDIFGAANTYVYQRVFGELHLSGFEVSHTKDGFRWEDAEDELIKKLHEDLTTPSLPILDQATNYRVKGIQKENKGSAERALESFEDAMDTGEELGHALEEVVEQASSSAASATDPPATRLNASAEDLRRTFALPYNGQEWQIKLVLSYDDSSRNWYEITDFAEDIKKVPRQLGVRLSMTHPFMDRHCDGSATQTQAFVRIAVCLALAETVARDSGQRYAGSVRTNFNELLRLAFSGR